MGIISKILGSNKLPFGLDIGYTSVRAVQLERKGKLVHLTGYGEAPIKEGVFAHNNINTDELAFAIKQVTKKSNINPITSKEVVCALPESDIFVKNLQLPQMEEDEAEEVVKYETEKIVPLPLDDLYLDYRVVKKGSVAEKDNYIVVAAPQKLIHSYTESLKKAELVPLALDVEPAAVSRALIPNKEKQESAQIIIDMGADTTTITIFDFNSIQLTGSTRIAGNEITNGFAKELNIETEKAEQIKRHVINSEKKLKQKLFDSAVKPVLNNLTKEIKRSMDYYKNTMESGHNFSKIILSGGNAHLVGMAEYLEEKFEIKTTIGNPWSNVTAYPLKAIPKIKASLYTTAIGLALRELVE